MSYATRQKQALHDVFARARRPLTAMEICSEAQQAIPSLGIATVYRALKRLVSSGELRLVEIPGTAPHYERAAPGHHHYFLCQGCRHLFDLAGCVHGLHALAPAGFRVLQHEIVLYGECKGCAGSGQKKSQIPAARLGRSS